MKMAGEKKIREGKRGNENNTKTAEMKSKMFTAMTTSHSLCGPGLDSYARVMHCYASISINSVKLAQSWRLD